MYKCTLKLSLLLSFSLTRSEISWLFLYHEEIFIPDHFPACGNHDTWLIKVGGSVWPVLTDGKHQMVIWYSKHHKLIDGSAAYNHSVSAHVYPCSKVRTQYPTQDQVSGQKQASKNWQNQSCCASMLVMNNTPTFQITYALTSGKAAKWTSCSEPELLWCYKRFKVP